MRKLERARLLSPTEYTFHPQLGYISLNSVIGPDEVLAVAYQYTVGNEIYQVGEFSSNGPSAPSSFVRQTIKKLELLTSIAKLGFDDEKHLLLRCL